MSFLKALFLRLFIFLTLVFLLICGITFGLLQTASQDLPNVESLNRFEPYLSTEIFASDGTLIGKVFAENRELLGWKDIPKDLKNAIVATEDARFYSHHGVDPHGVVRALLSNFRSKGLVEGGSTITQQLARNLFLSPERSFQRKIKEALLALEIERRFSKQEILGLYLNEVYFGAGAYGVQAAAQTYFGKQAKNLDLAQCAILAGLPQAPSVYSPLVDLEKAKTRQAEVLERMVDQGYITEQAKQEALTETLHFANPKNTYQDLAYPYFTTYVLHELFAKYPPEVVYKGGLKVYTTLDPHKQELALEALQKGLNRGKAEHINVSEGALVAAEPKTGYIRAMVGGYEFSSKNQFNRAWQARRQPGSSFKIFVYSCALENGYTPDTIVYDTPVSYPSFQGPWVPHDDDGKFWGPMPLRRALAYSRNVVAIRIAAQLGIDKIIGYAHRMGVDEPLDPYLPTAIGASVVTPMEMATAVSTLANEGIRVELTPIKYIQDRNGNVIEDHRIPARQEAIMAETARMMTDMMQDVIKFGTGTLANIGRPAAGKTGTASDFRDAWFVGFTPDLACVVWTGNDDFSKMHRAYGGYIPAMTWANFMKQALAGVPPHKFTVPQEKHPVKQIPGVTEQPNVSPSETQSEPTPEPTSSAPPENKDILNVTPEESPKESPSAAPEEPPSESPSSPSGPTAEPPSPPEPPSKPQESPSPDETNE